MPSSSYRVLVISEFHPAGMDLLRRTPDLDLHVVAPEDEAAVQEGVAWAQAIAVRSPPLTAELLATARSLEVVAKHGIGVDNIDIDHLTARGIPVVNAPGSNDRSVAEHAIMALLALFKRAPELDRWVRTGAWHRRLENQPRDVEGKRLLVVGYGRIGRRVAAMAQALDMEVAAHDPGLPEEAWRHAPHIHVADLHEGLGSADAVSLHVPRMRETLGLIGEREFGAMKPGALLVNLSRGGVVDESALRAALNGGRLSGAALDVLADEPPPSEHPLLHHCRVLFSPHAAALTEESAARMAVMTAENILGAHSGRLIPGHCVNAEGLRVSRGR